MIRVMLINDYPLIGNLVAASLEDEEDIQVVRNCTPKDDLFEAIQRADVDMVLISGRLSAVKAVDLVSQLDALERPLEILVLGLEEKEQSVLPFIEAGASGYVLKDASVEDLVNSIYSTHFGQAHISPSMARTLIERVYHLAGEFNGLDTSIFDQVELTPREVEVLELLGQNLSNQDIAAQLYVEVGTVKNHVHSILQKLDVTSRHEAAKYLAFLKR